MYVCFIPITYIIIIIYLAMHVRWNLICKSARQPPVQSFQLPCLPLTARKHCSHINLCGVQLRKYICTTIYKCPHSIYSGFEVTCPDCDLKFALDHAARDKKSVILRHFVFKIREHSSYEECSRNSNFECIMTNYDEL